MSEDPSNSPSLQPRPVGFEDGEPDREGTGSGHSSSPAAGATPIGEAVDQGQQGRVSSSSSPQANTDPSQYTKTSSNVSTTGNHPRIKKGVPASDPDALRNLIVNYLPPLMDEAQLHELFSQFGPIEKVKIIYDKVTGESRGYGFVLFQYFFSATYAISYLNRFMIAGKRLKVGYANAEAAKEAYDLLKMSATAFSAQQQQTLEYMYISQMNMPQNGGNMY